MREIPIIGSAFGALVDLLAGLIAGFDGRDKAFVIGFMILLVSFAVAVLIDRSHRKFIWSLRGPSGALAESAEPPRAAGDRVAAADTAFEGGPLDFVWRQYRLSLQKQDDGKFINLIDPRAWFSAEVLPGRGYEKWAGTWAGVFLTIGLFFTFVGLSAALFRVGEAGAEPELMRKAINSILSISSAKFVTSIAGIMAYIQWSLQARYYLSRQAKEAHRLAVGIQSLSRFVTPEVLLFEQAATGRKQLERLDHFTDDLAVAVDRSLRTVVGERLDRMPQELAAAVRPPLEESLRPVVEAVERSGANAGQRNEDALREMLDAFLKEVKGGAGEEMRSVGNAVAQVAQVLESMKGQIDASGKGFEEKLASAGDLLYLAADRMDKALAGNLASLSERIGAIDSALRGNAEKLDEVGTRMTSGVAEGLKAATDAMTEAARRSGDDAATALRTQVDALTQAMAKVAAEVAAGVELSKESFVGGSAAAAANMGAGAEAAGRSLGAAATKAAQDLGGAASKAVEDLGTASAAVAERLAQGAATAGADFTAAAAKIIAAAEDAAVRVAGAAESLGTRVAQATTGLQRLSDGTDAQTVRLDTAGRRLDEAGQAFVHAGTMARDAVAPIAASLQSVEEAVGQVKQAVDAHQRVDASARQALEQLNALAGKAAEHFLAQERRLGQLDGALEKTVLGIRDGVLNLSNTMSQALRNYDTEMSRAVGSLSNAVDGFSEQLEESLRLVREEA